MWLALITMALAATPAEDLADLMDQDAWSIGLVCTPVGAFYDTLLMGAQVLQAAGGVVDSELLDVTRGLLAEEPSLFPSQGTLRVALNEADDGPRHVALPYSGDTAGLIALAGPTGELLVVADDGGVTLKDVPAVVADGTLLFSRPGHGASTYPTALLAGLGGQTGCALAVDASVLGGAPGDLEAAALFLALDTEDLFVARVRGGPIPVVAEPLVPQESAFSGSSTLPPDVAVLLATDGLALLDVLAGAVPPDAAAELQALSESLGRQAVVPAGTTLGLFGRKESQRMVVVLPVHTPKGKPLKARKLRPLLEATLDGLEGEWEAQGDDGYRRVGVDGSETWIRYSAGQIVLGDLPETVIEAHEGAGEPWGHPQAAVLSSAWPVVAVPGHLPQLSAALPLAIGLRLHPDYLELGFDTLGDKGNDYLVGMIVGLAVPNFIEMRSRAWRATLEQELNAVVTAEIGHHAVHETFVAVPPAPRAVEDLDGDAVPWAADPAWAPLAFDLGGEDTRGTYTVELNEIGFMAHGFMDADSDGVPAHMVVTWTPEGPTPAVLLTSDGVY